MQGGRCQLSMSMPLRQLADKYKPDLHISKLICIAPETVCRKRMQLVEADKIYVWIKKKKKIQELNLSKTQASGSSGMSILWRTAVTGASAAMREGQSCCSLPPKSAERILTATSTGMVLAARWEAAASS